MSGDQSLYTGAVIRIFDHEKEEEYMFDKFLALGREEFVASTSDNFGSSSSARLVADWFAFVYLGCFVPDAPLSWVLAAAHLPYTVAQTAHGVKAVDVFDRWTGDRDKDVKMVQDMFKGADPATFMPCLDAMARDLQGPLKRSWLSPGGVRDERFRRLSKWMRGGWQAAEPDTSCTRHLRSLQRLPLRELAKREADIGIRLPVDMRRLLLEIGDVGVAIFAVPLSNTSGTIDACTGDWRWTSGVTISVDDVDFEETYLAPHFRTSGTRGIWQGAIVLGAGGGGDHTTLLLVASGKCRGQVWVWNEDHDYLPFTLSPLRPSSGAAGADKDADNGSQFLAQIWHACRIERYG